MSDKHFEKIKTKILSVIHQDARTAKGASASEMQRNFAVKAGVNEFLDLARQSYCEIVSSMSGKLLIIVKYIIMNSCKHYVCSLISQI